MASGALADIFRQLVISSVQTFCILKLSSLEINEMKFVTPVGRNVSSPVCNIHLHIWEIKS
jgi:hypothetical protein